MDIMAPGESIRATIVSSSTASYSGTSMATPHAAGAFAVLKAAVPDASVDDILNALKSTGETVTRSGSGIAIPRIVVNEALRELTDDGAVKVLGVLPGSVVSGSSYLRFYNRSSSSGSVSIVLRNGESGDEIATWNSEVIASDASLQISVSEIEKQSVPAVSNANAEYYTVDVTAGFTGYLQHVVWNRMEGTFTDMTACDNGLQDNSHVIGNIHTSRISSFPSFLRFHNSGLSQDRAELTIYDASTGVELGSWQSDIIPVGSSLQVSINEIEANASPSLSPGTGEFHYNLVLDAGFTGRMNHIVRASAGDSVTDVGRVCSTASN